MMIGIIFMNLAIFLFKSNLFLSLIFIGLNFGMFSSTVWPTLAFILKSNELGYGLGIITSLINFGCTMAGILFGYIRGTYGEDGVIIGLTTANVLVGCFAFGFYLLDKK